ncbi:discoidin domain-containing protein [Spirochaetia bacterium 38H-sp]|uniref:Discoidin domain-containing protein n=1 Tax=Rarispira pelagica TaxID=3141764 RepID=A0ABU9U8V4_9SPIR
MNINKKLIIFFTVFLLLFFVISCAGSASSVSKGPDPKVLIPHNGKKVFLNGMNLAWISFANDLTRFDEARFTQAVEDIASSGGNAIRWWLHVNGSKTPMFDENGMVKGMPDEALINLKKALDISFSRGVGLVLCLWSFDMLQPQTGVNQSRNLKLLEDEDVTRSYIENALIPMVRKVKNHPGIIAWEVFNEPEGMLPGGGWTPRRTEMQYVQRFINLVAGVIHRESPGALVTNGSGMAYQTDINGMINYYRDDRLIAAGGDPDGTLDFYSVHYYPQHMSEAISPFHHPASYWKLDKPIVVAEFPAKGIKDIGFGFRPKTSLSTEEAYLYLAENGYAGALSWTWTAHDGFGSIYDASPGISAVAFTYPEYVRLNKEGLDESPGVTTPIEHMILSVNKPDEAQVIDLSEAFEDKEDGDNLKYSVAKLEKPELISVEIKDNKAYISLKKKQIDSSNIMITATDSADNEAALLFTVYVLDPDRGNIALFKPTKASSIEEPNIKEYVNDGSLKTRWSSLYKDDQYIEINLEGKFRIDKAVLHWEVARAKDYDLLGSQDGKSWFVIKEVRNGKGDTDELEFEPVEASYVRMHGILRGTEWGFSLWEMEVYGERIK